MRLLNKPYSLFLVNLTFLVLSCAPSYATSKELVHFAGFAYSGSYSDITKAFPYTAAINEHTSGQVAPLDAALHQLLQNKSFPGFTLDYRTLGNIQSGDDLALAFALNNETVSVEHIQGVYKILFTLDAEALFFNMKQMEIVASYPFGLDYVDVSASPPTQAQIENSVSKLYLGGLNANILDQFVDALDIVQLKQDFGNTIQVSDVSIADKVVAELPAKMQSNLVGEKDLMATQFSNYLSKNGDVPVLPYTKDYAIGNKIATRFANGDVFNLQVPKPDYSVDLNLLGFKKLLYDQESSGASWIYGTFMHIRVSEPLSNHIYFDSTIKNAAVKVVPASQTNVDDWPAYQDALLGLMDQVTKQFVTPDSSWIGSHIGAAGDVQEFQNVAQVLKSCQ
jgi:hypothetical protein